MNLKYIKRLISSYKATGMLYIANRSVFPGLFSRVWTSFFNIREGADEGVADELGINLDLMAPLYHSHEVVGSVTAKAAKETGLIPGIPVVAGGLMRLAVPWERG